MDNKIFNKLQTLGRTFMLPIALLPIAGLFLGLGSGLTNPSFISQYSLEAVMGEGTIIYSILSVMIDVGDVVFSNLALLFAVSVASGLAKDRKEVAGLSAVVGYFTMYAALTSAIHNFRDMDALHEIEGLVGSVVGFEETLDTGVFGGIIIGLVVVFLHNKFYRVKFVDALSFFQGTHFIPIISTVAATLLGFFFAFIWPIVGAGIANLGELIVESGSIGSFLYGFIYRALIPFGLHHVFYLPFWQTALGGSMEVAGEMVHGAQNIVFAQLAAGESVAPEFAKYFSFQFPLMIGGWPAAALAMYHAARKEKKDESKGLLFGSSITSILTGITEPIEFTVLFASPFLFYGVHSILAGFSVILVEWLQAGVGLTFSGGLIDFIIYGIIPGNDRTNWMVLVPLIIFWAILYYAIFRFSIEKFNLKTPGREEDDEEIQVHTKDEYRKKHGIGELSEEDELSYQITSALGGSHNIDEFTNCATRLRVTVNDGEKVSEGRLRKTGAAGVVHNGKSVQVIYGTKVEGIAGDLNDFLKENPDIANESMDTDEEIDHSEEDTRQEKTEETESAKEIKEVVLSPMDGEVIPLEEVDDDVFSTKMMGDGIAILPSDGKVYAPVAGEITVTMDSNHAVGILSDDGAEILIHVGLDTVEMEGKGFSSHISKGDRVSAGDLLLEADLDTIKENDYDTTTMVIITNSSDYSEILAKNEKHVNHSDNLLEIK
ncbi:MAG: glucose PTS transporter subunit IIA [Atopostipes sp.]|nr:glucose PTS transporter subunit IIA [Atopostipes sp.]